MPKRVENCTFDLNKLINYAGKLVLILVSSNFKAKECKE